MTPDTPAETIAPPKLDMASIQRSLEEELKRREDIFRELAPRAIPHVDPVAYMAAAETRRVMDQLGAALDRISHGTYGRCVRCGGAVMAARLEALPYAETCIVCQNDVESS
ncbi:TraR/DksA C4-type zinc finger protein [Microbacterium sp. QXD-8]|uniref:TraR/DksA C4-type zinc finger protein n=1 Tax=Microbacterium psychrotolerans TaxID=3068321 RepID=A0ABU0Z6X2_9MICO|nr:TraR/DksA C4-type zinc finger protein [Microbacterium sp. QXD-8]MDQ7879271.1 TraR/DksA C4-type zinc finger protein [Microbacterium sp. QXD-8]